MDLGDTAARDLSPQVYSALRDWGDDGAHPGQLLVTARQRSEELDQLLVRIDERMQRWEDLHEIVELMIGIRNTQLQNSEKIPVDLNGGDKK